MTAKDIMIQNYNSITSGEYVVLFYCIFKWKSDKIHEVEGTNGLFCAKFNSLQIINLVTSTVIKRTPQQF